MTSCARPASKKMLKERRELAWIFMTYGDGSVALRDLGISKIAFWKLLKSKNPAIAGQQS